MLKRSIPSFREFVSFVWKLAKSCLFAVTFFVCLFFGKYVTTFGLHYYDFLFLCVLGTQGIFLLIKLETWDEVKIILIYHVLGFAMEAFKISPSIGSWEYPNPGFFTLLSVPLYSGFMYSAIGSFIFKAWDNLAIQFKNFPKFIYTIPIAILIYINFFSHHFIPDFRYGILILIVLVAWKTKVYFLMGKRYNKMNVLLGLFFVGFFIWVAENIATFFGARVYPNQKLGRHLVSFHKVFSRFLLFIVSFVVVSSYKMRFGKNVGVYTIKDHT